MREAYLLAVKWNLVVSAIGFCLFQNFPQFIISLFGDGDQLYFEFEVLLMRVYLFMVLVNGVQLLSSSFLLPSERQGKGLYWHSARRWKMGSYIRLSREDLQKINRGGLTIATA